MEDTQDFKTLLGSGLFQDEDKAVKTRVILAKLEEGRKQLEKRKPKDQLGYKVQAVHLFPEHPKAPYLDGGRFSDYAVSLAYTLTFIFDLKAEIKGEKTCSERSLLERKYVAAMARSRIKLENNPSALERTLNKYDDLIVPYIAKKYGLDEEYVRKGLLVACVNAMVDAFKERPELLRIYEQTAVRN